MEINNPDPSLFASALQELIDCFRTLSDGKKKEWEEVAGSFLFFNNATVEDIQSWLEDRAFPPASSLNGLIALATVYAKRDEFSLANDVITILDSTQPTSQQDVSETMNTLEGFVAHEKEQIPFDQKAGQNFLSLLNLPISFGELNKLPVVTKIPLSVKGTKCRTILQYYYSSPDKGALSFDLAEAFNAQLPTRVLEYLLGRLSYRPAEIGQMIQKIIFPEDEDSSFHAMVVNSKKFMQWRFDHREKLYEFGELLVSFLQQKEKEVADSVQAFINENAPKTLLGNTSI